MIARPRRFMDRVRPLLRSSRADLRLRVRRLRGALRVARRRRDRGGDVPGVRGGGRGAAISSSSAPPPAATADADRTWRTPRTGRRRQRFQTASRRKHGARSEERRGALASARRPHVASVWSRSTARPRMHALPARPVPDQRRLRRRRRERGPDVRRRGAGGGRGRQGLPFVGRAGSCSTSCSRSRSDPRRGIHRERPAMPASGKPRPAAARSRPAAPTCSQVELIEPKVIATLGTSRPS